MHVRSSRCNRCTKVSQKKGKRRKKKEEKRKKNVVAHTLVTVYKRRLLRLIPRYSFSFLSLPFFLSPFRFSPSSLPLLSPGSRICTRFAFARVLRCLAHPLANGSIILESREERNGTTKGSFPVFPVRITLPVEKLRDQRN